jgi:hypothetical protein
MEIRQRHIGKPNAAALPRNVREMSANFVDGLRRCARGDYDSDPGKTRMSVFCILGLEDVMKD